MASDQFAAAMTNRSLRIARSELEFLCEASVINPQQLSSILAELPADSGLSRQLQAPEPAPVPVPVPVQQPVQPSPPPVQQPVQPPPVQQPVQPPPAPYSPPAPYAPPTNQFANTTLNEKAPAPAPAQQYPSPPVPPPAYAQTPPALSMASALYAYTPTDPGDLALQPYDRVQVLEHMNNDWWRGRNERTGQEGIFPRSYVNVLQEKGAGAPPPTNYGNMPVEVSQSGSAPAETDGKGNKIEQHGKKFGKKMGNAAIFGAGATMGSNIVNSIF